MENIKKVLGNGKRQYGMGIALVFIIVLFSIFTNGVLLTPLNITNVILQNSYIMILAIGMLLTILTGNIDLSVGSVAAFVSAISGVLIIKNDIDTVPAILISLVIGAVIGAWNGFWIAYVRIPAFIVTLGGELVFRGLTLVILQGQTLSPFPSATKLWGPDFFLTFSTVNCIPLRC